jgi:SAM-dependent methyltransferase
MPACKDCFQFDGENCELGYGRMKQKLRACSFSIFIKHLPRIKGSVLEVGPGTARYVCKNVRKNGAAWTAIDPRAGKGNEGPLFVGTVGNLPFPAGTFDWVISLASIEHWMEHGDGILTGLREIHRVLKPGGTMLIDCPFHVHGDDAFFFGRDDDVKAVIREVPWSSLYFEEWRRDHEPLEALRPWDIEKEPRREHLRQMFPPDGPSQWFLEVVATK